MLKIVAGRFEFGARWEAANAPSTVSAIRRLLPLRSKIIQARWSGESAWVPLGDLELGVAHENHTSHPAPGHLLLYPGGISETEILFPYGATLFGSRMGQLAGNYFATIEKGAENLPEFGRVILWEGAQDFTLEEL